MKITAAVYEGRAVSSGFEAEKALNVREVELEEPGAARFWCAWAPPGSAIPIFR